MVTLTAAAIKKVKEVLDTANPKPTALRIGVRGGGCSGFQYALELCTEEPKENDEVLEFDGLKVYLDNMSAMYLDGCEIDYVEDLVASGFKFNNPNVSRTCGCGQSFSA